MLNPGHYQPVLEDRLHATAEHRGPAVIVQIDGEIDYATAGLFREHVTTATLTSSPPYVVLDLEQVTFCDSSGLGVMIALWKAVRALHGNLVVARPSRICRRILER